MIRATQQMRFGWLAEQRLPWTQLLEVVEYVERLGYDGVWLSDHPSDENGSWLSDAWTTLGAILGRIPRIEAGTLVASNSLRSPLLTTHMARTLACIAPGRFVLGLGTGGSGREHRRVGVAFEELDRRAANLARTCALVRSCTGADSPWPQAHDESPNIPLLLGGGSPQVLQVAGQAADRWAIWGTPNQLATKGEMLSDYAQAAGREPETIRRGAIVMVIPDHLPARQSPTPWPAVLAGRDSAVTNQLAEYAAAGVNDIVFCDYAIEPAYRRAALEWFATVILPFRCA